MAEGGKCFAGGLGGCGRPNDHRDLKAHWARRKTRRSTAKNIFAAKARRSGGNCNGPRATLVVRRDDGITVIAGYPWLLDWGRDSLICARGLLAAGRLEQVKQLLVIFGRFAKDGTLPNTIHGEDASNRDTSDAPLWYGIVCEEAAAALGDSLHQVKTSEAGGTIADVLLNIASGYERGTPNGIRMDPQSGLIWSPSHFTWMDTKSSCWHAARRLPGGDTSSVDTIAAAVAAHS